MPSWMTNCSGGVSPGKSWVSRYFENFFGKGRSIALSELSPYSDAQFALRMPKSRKRYSPWFARRNEIGAASTLIYLAASVVGTMNQVSASATRTTATNTGAHCFVAKNPMIRSAARARKGRECSTMSKRRAL